MKTSLVSSVYRRNSILPTSKTDLPIFKTIGFREENKRQKFFTISKTGKPKTAPLSIPHKFSIPSKSSQSRWKAKKNKISYLSHTNFAKPNNLPTGKGGLSYDTVRL